MGRKQKHPNHTAEAQRRMDEMLKEVVELWAAEKEPELKAVADAVEMSPAKLRKLLITAGVRDGKEYYRSSTADYIIKLKNDGLSVAEIQKLTNLSYTSVQGYLPYSKIIYSLDTMSTECERIRLYRRRAHAVDELKVHLGLLDCSVWLWKAIIAFQSYPFTTSGRGSRPGIKFTYTISRSTGTSGRHYKGEEVPGFGNEMWIIKDGQRTEKSISRSTVDLAFKNALEEQERSGCVSGPRKLGVPGVRSNLYAIFLRFGVITAIP